jgi:hypothetical protein
VYFQKDNIRNYLKYSLLTNILTTSNLKYIRKLGGLISLTTKIVYTIEINSSIYTLIYKNGKLTMSPKKINKDDLFFTKGSFISEYRFFFPMLLSCRNINL